MEPLQTGGLVRARGNRELEERFSFPAGCLSLGAGCGALLLVATWPLGAAVLGALALGAGLLPRLGRRRRLQRQTAACIQQSGGSIEAVRAEVIERHGAPWCLVVVWFHSFFYSRVPEIELRLRGHAFRPEGEALSLGSVMRTYRTGKPKRSGRWAFRFLFPCRDLVEPGQELPESVWADFEVRVLAGPLAQATFVVPLEAGAEVPVVAALEVRSGGTGFCPVCGDDLRDQVVRCPQCETPHHRDCWEWARSCATYGCAGWA